MNVLDLHYLLTQIERIETQLIPSLAGEVSSLEDVDPSKIVEALEQQISIWSESKQQQPDQRIGLRSNKIMRLKWREQALRARDKLL